MADSQVDNNMPQAVLNQSVPVQSFWKFLPRVFCGSSKFPKIQNSKNSESCHKPSCMVIIYGIENRRTTNTSPSMGSSPETAILSATIPLSYTCMMYLGLIQPVLPQTYGNQVSSMQQSGMSMACKTEYWCKNFGERRSIGLGCLGQRGTLAPSEL